MHDFRDVSGIAGVAQARTGTQTDELAHVRAQTLSSAEDFANPQQNIHYIGVTTGMRVADFGAGSGAYSLAAARAVGKGGKVYAVEVQKDLLTRIKNDATREKLDNIEIIWGDFEMPKGSRIAASSVDVVILSNVLFQLDHKLGAFHEANRILKPSGKLAVIDWTESFGGMGPQKNCIVSKEESIAFAETAGFICAKQFPAGAHHYGIIFTPLSRT